MFILLRDKIGLGAGAKSRKQKGRWETQGQKPRLVFPIPGWKVLP